MNINVTPLSIDLPASIKTRLITTKPKDSAKNPVAMGLRNAHRLAINLTTRSTANKDGVLRLASANLGSDSMLAERCTFATVKLPNTVCSGRNVSLKDSFFTLRVTAHHLLSDTNLYRVNHDSV
jgi:hypothetical protein